MEFIPKFDRTPPLLTPTRRETGASLFNVFNPLYRPLLATSSVHSSFSSSTAAMLGAETVELEWSAKHVRGTFIKFFQEKNHVYWKSSPVVPLNDPTLLFANAGYRCFTYKRGHGSCCNICFNEVELIDCSILSLWRKQDTVVSFV